MNTARNEVDMQNLISALIGVVEDTMQPDRIELWLHSGEEENAS
jgi:hypothetical protein